MRTSVISLTLLALALPLATAPLAHADAAKAKASYEQRCSTCHGALGAGDGPIAASLPPEMKPRNFQKDSFKFAVDGAKFNELLKKGGAAVGLNPLMPMQPDLSDSDIADLYEYVKSLKK